MNSVLTCGSPDFTEACDALQGRLDEWWATRRQVAESLSIGEIDRQVAAFYRDRPEYESFRREIGFDYKIKPGSLNRGCFCCNGNWPSAKAIGVEVFPMRWAELRNYVDFNLMPETFYGRTHRKPFDHVRIESGVDFTADHLPKPPPVPRIKVA